jgi:tetratricopeptide (TPR) repeat protein
MQNNIYIDAEQYEKAVETFKKVIAQNPKLAGAHYNLGIAYLSVKRRNVNAAMKEYSILRKLNKDLAEELLEQIESVK